MKIKEKKRLLLETAKRLAKPMGYTKFVCPFCGDIASVTWGEDLAQAECPGCGVHAEEREGGR